MSVFVCHIYLLGIRNSICRLQIKMRNEVHDAPTGDPIRCLLPVSQHRLCVRLHCPVVQNLELFFLKNKSILVYLVSDESLE